MGSVDSYLYAIAVGQALLIGAMLLASPERGRKPVTYLAASLWVFAGLFTVVLLKEHSAPDWTRDLDLPLGLALGPLLWLQAEASIGRRPGGFRRDAPWLAPAALGLLPALGLPVDAAWLRAFMLLLLAAAVVWSLVALTRFVRRFDDHYADAGPTRMAWLRNIHAGLAVIVAAALAQHFIERDGPSSLNRFLIAAIPAGFILLNATIAISLISVRSLAARAIPPPTRRARDRLDAEDLRRIQARLQSAMHERQLYRDPGLQLRGLAEATGLAEYDVTEAIRRGLARNFFDFVNGYRVADARARLAQGDASVTEAMLAAGFNSKSSFYVEYRKRTGETPLGTSDA